MTDLTTLSRLLSSQEARDAAPCVAVSGEWYLTRNGHLHRVITRGTSSYFTTGQWSYHNVPSAFDCIWSGDLPAILAEMVAENEGLRSALRESSP